MISGIHKSEIVKHLIIINVILFVVSEFLFRSTNIDVHRILGLNYFSSDSFKLWQPITHMFMHGGFGHIFFNMYALYIFGSVLEKVWGTKRFLFFYISTGLGAALIQTLAYGITFKISFGTLVPAFEYGPLMIGASGAITGVIAGFGILFPNTELQLLIPPVRVKAKWLAIIMIALSFFIDKAIISQFSDVGVAHWAHIGGAIFGYIIVKVWQKNKKQFY